MPDMTAFHVQIDTRDIENGMRDIPKEIPFAISLSLTWTARDCAAALRFTMKDHFTLRTDELPRRIGSYMTRRGDQEIIVGSKSWYMALQAEGGTRTGNPNSARNRDKLNWIPTKGGGRRNAQSITRQSRWPGEIDGPGNENGKGDVFTGYVRTSKGLALGTWRRVIRASEPTAPERRGKVMRKGGWRGQAVRTGLELLYWTKDEAKIPQRWPLEKTVSDVVAEVWDHHAMRALDWTLKNPNAKANRAPIYR